MLSNTEYCPFNRELLESVMSRRNDTKAELAHALGISKQRIYQIFTGQGNWTLRQVQMMAVRYSLTPDEVYDIFIADFYKI